MSAFGEYNLVHHKFAYILLLYKWLMWHNYLNWNGFGYIVERPGSYFDSFTLMATLI